MTGSNSKWKRQKGVTLEFGERVEDIGSFFCFPQSLKNTAQKHRRADDMLYPPPDLKNRHRKEGKFRKRKNMLNDAIHFVS